jgi:hypothetical protein
MLALLALVYLHFLFPGLFLSFRFAADFDEVFVVRCFRPFPRLDDVSAIKALLLSVSASTALDWDSLLDAAS